MKKLLIPLLVAFSGAPAVGNAAILDLTTFLTFSGTNSNALVIPTLAELIGTASITAQVSGLASFEWKFTAGDIFVPSLDVNDYSYLTTSGGKLELSDVQAVGVQGTSGWKQYAFSSPYSGNIILGVENRFDDEDPSQLQLRNLITAAPVPEPSSSALLLAGMGLLGAIAKRGNRRRATI